jgi:hypothetical protein
VYITLYSDQLMTVTTRRMQLDGRKQLGTLKIPRVFQVYEVPVVFQDIQVFQVSGNPVIVPYLLHYDKVSSFFICLFNYIKILTYV